MLNKGSYAQGYLWPFGKIIYATAIDLCTASLPWASFLSRNGAIILHSVLTGPLPQGVLVTECRTQDRRAIQNLQFEPGRLVDF